MILHAADTHGWTALVLWKKDQKVAFNLLNYNLAYCRLFAFHLSDDVTMIHLAGLFGERHATYLPGPHKITSGIVFIHNFRVVLLVRR